MVEWLWTTPTPFQHQYWFTMNGQSDIPTHVMPWLESCAKVLNGARLWTSQSSSMFSYEQPSATLWISSKETVWIWTLLLQCLMGNAPLKPFFKCAIWNRYKHFYLQTCMLDNMYELGLFQHNLTLGQLEHLAKISKWLWLRLINMWKLNACLWQEANSGKSDVQYSHPPPRPPHPYSLHW